LQLAHRCRPLREVRVEETLRGLAFGRVEVGAAEDAGEEWLDALRCKRDPHAAGLD
jgi:hypothetical protein